MTDNTNANRAKLLCAEFDRLMAQPRRTRLKHAEALNIVAKLDGLRNDNVVAANASSRTAFERGIERMQTEVEALVSKTSKRFDLPNAGTPNRVSIGLLSPFELHRAGCLARLAAAIADARNMLGTTTGRQDLALVAGFDLDVNAALKTMAKSDALLTGIDADARAFLAANVPDHASMADLQAAHFMRHCMELVHIRLLDSFPPTPPGWDGSTITTPVPSLDLDPSYLDGVDLDSTSPTELCQHVILPGRWTIEPNEGPLRHFETEGGAAGNAKRLATAMGRDPVAFLCGRHDDLTWHDVYRLAVIEYNLGHTDGTILEGYDVIARPTEDASGRIRLYFGS